MNVLQKLRKASKEREKFWNPSGAVIPLGFRIAELAGEAGEVANAGKKLMRHEMGMVGGTDDMTNMKEELGDVIISAELIAAHLGIDLWACVVEKFNKTSDKHGFPIKMDREGNVVPPNNVPDVIHFVDDVKNGKVVVKDGSGRVIGAQG